MARGLFLVYNTRVITNKIYASKQNRQPQNFEKQFNFSHGL